jgi:predicted N-acetyltransferase YhbS
MQLEIIRAHEPTEPQSFDQLVLYLDGSAAVEAATAPLQAAGLTAKPGPLAYWAANGAVIYADPDGREVVFAPWVYGRDPEPVDQHGPVAPTGGSVQVEEYHGDRALLRPLFSEAEDSVQQLDSYINDGRVLVARRGAEDVGHLQLVAGEEGAVELKNMAVLNGLRGAGIGRALVHEGLAAATAAGAHRVVVATAAADIGNLRFYQRCGFRLLSVEPDAFSPETGYPEQVVIDGIPLRDRIWLHKELPTTPPDPTP